MGSILSTLWRRKLLFCACFAVLLSGALAVILHLKPRYTSEALLIIDPRQTHITNLQSVQEAPSGISDLNFVRSEMQILDSDELALHVVEKLNLQDDPEFGAQPQGAENAGTLELLLARLGLQRQPRVPRSPEARTAAAVAAYKSHFSSFNDTRSFIIAVSFSASDPVLAQRVLAAHLETYLNDQRTAKQLVIRKAESWFESELGHLSAQLLAAEAKQQEFRSQNGLLKIGGDTMAGRQLTDIIGQLAEARLDFARKTARYQQLSNIARGGPGAGGADTALLSSDLLQRLRTQEAVASQNVAGLQEKFGRNYPDLRTAKANLTDVRANLGAELGRLVASAKQDALIAQNNVAGLERTKSALEVELGTTSAAELTANQIARETDADRRLYDDLLARSKQVAVQRETQEPDARLVSTASLALRPTFPRVGVLGAIAATGAAIIAGMLAVARDLLQTRTFKSVGDVELQSGIPGLATVPKVRFSPQQRWPSLTPGSQLAISFQTLRNSVFFRCQSDGPNVVVFTSAMASEGKTLVSLLFAKSVAMNGRRVLVIDGDLRRAGLTRLLRLDTPGGLGQVLRGLTSLADSVTRNQDAGCDILASDNRTAEPEYVLSPESIRIVLQEARNLYDVIVIDTPALAIVDDALSFAAVADATVLVVRWAGTRFGVLHGALRRLRLAGANVVGAMLNAVDPSGYEARDLEAYRLLARPSSEAA
ncbi:MAG TPA: Wzz/FepE/Etk N-terminal domain-containing protein [Rhodopila sp.]